MFIASISAPVPRLAPHKAKREAGQEAPAQRGDGAVASRRSSTAIRARTLSGVNARNSASCCLDGQRIGDQAVDRDHRAERREQREECVKGHARPRPRRGDRAWLRAVYRAAPAATPCEPKRDERRAACRLSCRISKRFASSTRIAMLPLGGGAPQLAAARGRPRVGVGRTRPPRSSSRTPLRLQSRAGGRLGLVALDRSGCALDYVHVALRRLDQRLSGRRDASNMRCSRSLSRTRAPAIAPIARPIPASSNGSSCIICSPRRRASSNDLAAVLAGALQPLPGAALEFRALDLRALAASCARRLRLGRAHRGRARARQHARRDRARARRGRVHARDRAARAPPRSPTCSPTRSRAPADATLGALH